MGEMNIDNIKAQMRKGILEYCILSIISRNDAYASSIIAELKAAEMIVVEGTLYPLLTRQKNQGLLAYRWEESPQGPPRKYYSITEKGRQCLEQLDMAWTELISQIRTIREGAPRPDASPGGFRRMTRACFTGLKHMTMNHTINVSIAGVAFVLDSEGYELLKDYLVRIEVAYKDDPDGAEILSDIEARVSELILNRQSSDMIVSPELIREIIGQLGWPDGVTAQGPAGGAEIPENGADNAISRRLYRNPDGAKLGGVCNGLATYFRVDPTLVRLLFCSPLLILVVISVIPVVNALCGFFGTLIGVSFLLYLILWFAIPKARTPRQRLEMTGERITASSIRRNISADLNDARPSPRNERTASVFSELLYVTGRVLLFCIKAFLLLIGAVLGLVVLGLVVGLVTMLIGGAAVGFPFALAGGSLLIPVLIVLGIVLPLGIVVYLLLKLVFNLRSRRTTLSVLFGIWVLILIFLGVYLVKNYERIEEAFDRGDVEWYFNKTSGWHGAGVPDGIPIRHDTVRVETVTLGDSTLRDTVRISIIPNSRSPFRQKRNGRLAFPSEPNRIKRRSYASIYRACSHPEELLCLLRSRVSYPVRSLP